MQYEMNFIEIEESRKMFEEIMTNYYQKNYRSCIVTINSLLYYDLMKKIEILKDSYNDNKSKKIYDEINKMINNNDKYSDIEINLLNLCKERNLINNYFYEKAENLRKVRNHCAHPAFHTGELYIPSNAEVSMYIDYIYNDLLIINSINYYNAVDFVLDDIKEAYNKEIGYTNDALRTRACRLYSKFDDKNRQKIFNSLFELSIIKNDDDSKKYRDYTYYYMLWLVSFLKSKNIVLDLSVIKKIKIAHLDRNFFDYNPYIKKIIIDSIITMKNVEENNSEIYELYKQFLYESDNLYEMYEQLFASFSDYIKYLVSDCDNWRIVYNTINKLDKAKTKPYFYKLLSRLVILTPNINGFDKSDVCISLFVENSYLLSVDEQNEIFKLMLLNNQFFNTSKRKNDDNKSRISELFGVDFNKKRDEIKAIDEFDL